MSHGNNCKSKFVQRYFPWLGSWVTTTVLVVICTKLKMVSSILNSMPLTATKWRLTGSMHSIGPIKLSSTLKSFLCLSEGGVSRYLCQSFIFFIGVLSQTSKKTAKRSLLKSSHTLMRAILHSQLPSLGSWKCPVSWYFCLMRIVCCNLVSFAKSWVNEDRRVSERRDTRSFTGKGSGKEIESKRLISDLASKARGNRGWDWYESNHGNGRSLGDTRERERMHLRWSKWWFATSIGELTKILSQFTCWRRAKLWIDLFVSNYLIISYLSSQIS